MSLCSDFDTPDTWLDRPTAHKVVAVLFQLNNEERTDPGGLPAANSIFLEASLQRLLASCRKHNVGVRAVS